MAVAYKNKTGTLTTTVKLGDRSSASAFFMEHEINIASIAGRTMITIIFPTKDWISFVGALDCGFGLHATYLIDTTPQEVCNFVKKFVSLFTEEIFLEDRNLRIC